MYKIYTLYAQTHEYAADTDAADAAAAHDDDDADDVADADAGQLSDGPRAGLYMRWSPRSVPK